MDNEEMVQISKAELGKAIIFYRDMYTTIVQQAKNILLLVKTAELKGILQVIEFPDQGDLVAEITTPSNTPHNLGWFVGIFQEHEDGEADSQLVTKIHIKSVENGELVKWKNAEFIKVIQWPIEELKAYNANYKNGRYQ